MKNIAKLLLLLLVCSAISHSHAGVGQSSVITLVFPYGARSSAMGEVGTALADDGSVLFFNPAGLDLPNSDWEGGACSNFYEPLLPAFQIKDLWHTALSVNFQDTAFRWGQVGFYRNFINMGTHQWTDDLGNVLGSARSYETVYAFGWGFDFKEFGIKNHYFGLTIKYINSALAPNISGPGTGIARSFAVDFGYLWTIGKGLRLGATLMNMGPAVYYIDPQKSDPIPFEANLAIAYKKNYEIDGIKFLKLAGEMRYNREIVKNYLDKPPDPFYRAISTDLLNDKDESMKFELQQINRHIGGEFTLFNTFSYRMGYLIDIVGERYEFHRGCGIKLFNHFSFDWANIFSPEGYMRAFAERHNPESHGSSGARNTPEGIRNQQISFTATRLFKWDKNDLFWWESLQKDK